jgi:phosphatidylethanolamine-binding protein (PEBP) family uncharacterized protein
MKKYSESLVLVCALALGGGWACSSAGPKGGSGGAGGEGGEGDGGSGGSTGGSGGKASGGSGGSAGGSGGSTGGSGGSTGGSGGGSGGSTGGSGGSTGGSGGGGVTADAGVDGPPTSGGKFTITVDGIMMGDRLCFKPEAANNGPNGGNVSPKIDWTTPPDGTKSLVLTMYDQSNTTPHRIVCNIPPDVMGQVANVKTMVPMGAQVSTGHGKQGNPWYGPGAGGNAHSYEIKIWALSTPMLEGGCGVSTAAATRAVYAKLKAAPATLVLASDGKVLWGNVDGKCMP